jgi:RNA polymerase sigma-70 factor (ECF subfamily)
LLAAYVQTGSREAFEGLVWRYERELYGYLHHILGDAQLAEDAFQSTFLQVHLKCRQFQPGRKLRPWLYAIVNHQAVDLLRRNRRHQAASLNAAAGNAGSNGGRHPLGDLLASKETGLVARLELNEESETTRQAVNEIPAKLRHALILVVYQGLKYSEAAEVLGIPLGTVKSRINKAMRILRDAFSSLA